MYKVIIFNNNLETIKKICNVIFNNFSNMILSGIASNKGELSYVYENSKANIIIISQKDSQNKHIQKILDEIKYKIILCDKSELQKNSKYSLYIPYDAEPNFIINKVENFISNVNERAIYKKAHHILEMLNFDFKLAGTKYLLESIVYSYLNKDNYLFENLEKKIFPYVAQKYSTSTQNIKWSIIRSVNNMNSNVNTLKLRKQYSDFPEKITCKMLIFEIVNRI